MCIRDRLEETKGLDVSSPVRVFVYDSGEDTPFTAGLYAMPTALIEAAGGKNVMDNFRKSWGTVTWEEVIDRNPEVIVIVNYGNVTAEQKREFMMTNPAFAEIDAVKNGQLKEIIRDEMKPNYLFDGDKKTKILKLCMDMALDIGPDAFIRQSIALRDRIDQKNTLRTYKRPALVLCGRHDVLCPLERHELMHNLLENSKLVEKNLQSKDAHIFYLKCMEIVHIHGIKIFQMKKY